MFVLVKKVLVLVLALMSACAGADTSVCTGTMVLSTDTSLSVATCV